jgi:MarR family transcriptional regulator, lower aerobic nicotinate degradation pathway regulator
MKRVSEPETEPGSGADGQPLSVVDALAQLSFIVQGALSAIAAEHDLSLIQTRLLGVLRDRSPGMNELARFLELDKSSVTGLVDRAEQRGLVRRKVSPEDRRAIDVSITPAGLKIVRRVEIAFGERIAALVRPLTEAQRAGMVQIASRIVAEDARSHGTLLSRPPAKSDK